MLNISPGRWSAWTKKDFNLIFFENMSFGTMTETVKFIAPSNEFWLLLPTNFELIAKIQNDIKSILRNGSIAGNDRRDR